MQARDSIIDLTNVDALEVIRLALLAAETALVNTLAADVGVAELAIH